MAGVSAAAAIRELDREGEILLADGEGDLPYARPMLTKRPLASFDRCDIPLHDEGWYREQRITLLRGARVEGLDAAAKTVRVGGETIEYGRCILATGASNFVPPFAGKEPLDDGKCSHFYCFGHRRGGGNLVHRAPL